RHVDVPFGISGNAVRRAELAGSGAAGLAPRLHPVAILIVFGHARIDVPVADEDVALRVPGDVGRLPELPVHGRARRGDARPRPRFIRGFLLAAEDHRHPAFRVEPDDHVRPFVHGPDVVVPVYAHRVRIRPRVKVFADLADEPAVGAEFEQLGGTRPVSGARRVAAGEDEDVFLRVDRDAYDLAQMQVRRELEKVGYRFVWDFRRRCDGLLTECESTKADQCNKRTEFHGRLLRYFRVRKDSFVFASSPPTGFALRLRSAR